MSDLNARLSELETLVRQLDPLDKGTKPHRVALMARHSEAASLRFDAEAAGEPAIAARADELKRHVGWLIFEDGDD